MGSFLLKARSFSSASRGGGSETRRRMNRNANIHCNARRHSRLCRIARASPRAERGAGPHFSDRSTDWRTNTCAGESTYTGLSLSAFLLYRKKHPYGASGDATKRPPHPIKNQTLVHGRQRTEQKPGKAVSGRARGVGERILPKRENIDIQKTSEKFCDPQIYP